MNCSKTKLVITFVLGSLSKRKIRERSFLKFPHSFYAVITRMNGTINRHEALLFHMGCVVDAGPSIMSLIVNAPDAGLRLYAGASAKRE